MIRGHRPSYREALLYLRDHLSVKCPGGLATAVPALIPQALPGPETCIDLLQLHAVLRTVQDFFVVAARYSSSLSPQHTGIEPYLHV